MKLPQYAPAAGAVIQIRDLCCPRKPGAAGYRLECPGYTTLNEPGLTAVVGESGVGKSTLLSVLAGRLTDYSGSVEVMGTRLDQLRSRRDRHRLTSRVGVIPQQPRLISHKTVYKNIDQVLLDNGVRDAQERQRRVRQVLCAVGITHLADRLPNEMSGGERQRLQIAKVMVRDVGVVFADEPTSMLHERMRDDVMGLLEQLAERIPVVLVTHDQELASRCRYRVELRRPGGLRVLSGEVPQVGPTPRVETGVGAPFCDLGWAAGAGARHPAGH